MGFPIVLNHQGVGLKETAQYGRCSCWRQTMALKPHAESRGGDTSG